jgi:predicted nucleic acid-binding Zn ribbon protein
MPIYVYETVPGKSGKPARRFEVSQRMSDPALTKDPSTGEAVRRVIIGGLGLMNVGAEKNSAAAPQGHSCAPGCSRH